MWPTKGEGGMHIGFTVDPGFWHWFDSFLYPQYLLNQWVEFHQTSIDASRVYKIFVTLTSFSRSLEDSDDCFLYPQYLK